MSKEFTIYVCTLQSDTNGDCRIDMIDLATLTLEWMQNGYPF